MDISKVKSILSSLNSQNISLSQNSGFFSGSLKIDVVHAENLKTPAQSGKANPYIIIRIPETLQNFTSSQRVSTGSANAPSSLIGATKVGEIVKSRVIYDNINPNWDETFQVLVRNVDKLDLQVFTKNNLFADELLASSSLDLKGNSELRRRIANHKAQDIFIDLEPQGRVYLKITNEGE
jgi:Ca2+-dependent lipid-binding protein